MFYLQQLLCLIVGYCFGLMETGVIYGKIAHVDLRHKGSGNTGATNTFRVAGKKAGAIVLAGDMLKCAIPALLAWLIFKDYGGDARIFMLMAGFGAILGHNFPFYMGFKGGKGVACSAILIIIFDPVVALICAFIFFGILYFTGYVSLASMVGASCAYIGFLIRNLIFPYGFSAVGTVEFVILWLLMVLLLIYKHKANIERLRNHTENRFHTRKRKEDEEK